MLGLGIAVGWGWLQSYAMETFSILPTLFLGELTHLYCFHSVRFELCYAYGGATCVHSGWLVAAQHDVLLNL
jgi:hypothetical protein